MDALCGISLTPLSHNPFPALHASSPQRLTTNAVHNHSLLFTTCSNISIIMCAKISFFFMFATVVCMAVGLPLTTTQRQISPNSYTSCSFHPQGSYFKFRCHCKTSDNVVVDTDVDVNSLFTGSGKKGKHCDWCVKGKTNTYCNGSKDPTSWAAAVPDSIQSCCSSCGGSWNNGQCHT